MTSNRNSSLNFAAIRSKQSRPIRPPKQCVMRWFRLYLLMLTMVYSWFSLQITIKRMQNKFTISWYTHVADRNSNTKFVSKFSVKEDQSFFAHYSQSYSSIDHVMWCVQYPPATMPSCIKAQLWTLSGIHWHEISNFLYFVERKQSWTARSIGEVDPFKLTWSSNTRNKLILQDLHAMLFAKWITINLSINILV